MAGGRGAGPLLLPPPQAVMRRKKQHAIPINEFLSRFLTVISLRFILLRLTKPSWKKSVL
jgi:hypothetical protein